jgi:hypothetical protein
MRWARLAGRPATVSQTMSAQRPLSLSTVVARIAGLVTYPSGGWFVSKSAVDHLM